jgi:hypothetical protein
MNTRSINNIVKVIIALTGLTMASTAIAAQATPPKTTPQVIEKKVTDAIAAISAMRPSKRPK